MSQNTKVLNQIPLSPSLITRVLGISAFFLILASVAGQFVTYAFGYDYIYNLHYVFVLIKMFYVDLEQNFPAYFSAAILLFASLLLLVIAILEGKRKSSGVSKWSILALCFLGLSVDESLSFHERLIVPMRNLMNNDNLGIFFYAWVVPGIAIVLIFSVFFLRFFLTLNAKTRLNFIISAALYIGGAIGIEFLNGYYAELHGEQNLIYSLLSNLEECMEMAGIIIFIRGLLEYIASNFKAVHFQVMIVPKQLPSDLKG